MDEFGEVTSAALCGEEMGERGVADSVTINVVKPEVGTLGESMLDCEFLVLVAMRAYGVISRCWSEFVRVVRFERVTSEYLEGARLELT